jgi:hypothetical protein
LMVPTKSGDVLVNWCASECEVDLEKE